MSYVARSSETSDVILSEVRQLRRRQDKSRNSLVQSSLVLLVAWVALVVPALSLMIQLDGEKSSTEFTLSVTGVICTAAIALGLAAMVQLKQQTWTDGPSAMDLTSGRYSSVTSRPLVEMEIARAHGKFLDDNRKALRSIERYYCGQIVVIVINFAFVGLGINWLL